MSEKDDKGKPVSLTNKLRAVVAEVIFTPTDTQLLVKSKFWRRMKENPMHDANRVSAATVEQITGSSQVRHWWSDKSFKEWFLDKDYVQHGLQGLAEMGIQVMMDILMDPKQPAAAKANILKMVYEFADYRPAIKKQIKWADAEIANMEPDEVDKRIKEMLRSGVAK